MKNSIKPDQYTPTQVKTTLSNIGSLSDCITKLKELAKWDEGQVIKAEKGMIRAKGMGCFWKTSDSPVNAVSGVFLSFNTDGSINLNSGAVIRAAEDLIKQLKSLAAHEMKVTPEDVEVENERVYLKQDTEIYVGFKDLVRGSKQANGLAIEGQILGRGSYIMSHIYM